MTDEWDLILKYFLFAYRNSPHTNTGFSPFEVVYVRALRGPLKLLHEGWTHVRMPSKNVVDWVNDLVDHLETTRAIVEEREVKAKSAMKKKYDVGTRTRNFAVGDMVQIRIPEMHRKLEDIWEGPYEVIRLIHDVTLEIAVPSRLTKRQVVHLDRVKAWIATEAAILQVVVAQDDEDNISTLIKDHPLKELQQEQIDQLLHKYKEVVTERLEKTKTVLLQIITGQAAPICAHPHLIHLHGRTRCKRRSTH